MSKKPKKKLGELLIEHKLINPIQLQEALKIQEQTGEYLGQVLVKLDYLTQEDIADILAIQLGVARVNLSDMVMPSDVVKLIPDILISRHRVVPIKKEGNKITVAMVDPLNLVVLDDLQIATGCQIEPMIATEKEIDIALEKLLSFQNLINKAIREFEIMPVVSGTSFNLDDISDFLVDEAPTVKIVNSMIQQAVRERASDIHIEPREFDVRIRIRVDGVLRNMMILPCQSHPSLVSRIKIMADMDIAEKRIPLDGRIQVKILKKSIDLRVSTIPTIFGEKVVIRILDKGAVMAELDQLGFTPEFLKKYREHISRPYGMILITGPTGSGKTTTLYSTLNEINSPGKNIITIEDPVEYILDDINQIKVNRKAGLTFAVGLRAILRQDPDVVMVGEIRDSDTAGLSVRAATTGHLVFSTMHTNDAAGALPRLIDMGAEPFLVASSVIAVVAQRLVRVICPSCKKSFELPNHCSERQFLNIPVGIPVTLFKGSGCVRCGYTGYYGRLAVQELLPVTGKQRELIISRASAGEIRRLAVEEGMITITQDGIQKVLMGLTTLEEMTKVALIEE